MNPMRALTDTPFGPVIRALLSQIAMDPAWATDSAQPWSRHVGWRWRGSWLAASNGAICVRTPTPPSRPSCWSAPCTSGCCSAASWIQDFAERVVATFLVGTAVATRDVDWF